MTSLFLVAILLSIDSVLVSFALGACRIERRQEHRLAVLFGVCDGVASLIGMLLGVSIAEKIALVGHWGGPVLVCAYAIIILMTSRMGQSMANSGSPRRMRMLYLLPLVMSIDNLAASVSFAHTGGPLLCATVIGLVSGLASLLGFRAGELALTATEWLRDALAIRWKSTYFGGIVLLGAAVLLAIF
jgi:putative Mn2+ efflux pump MntP